MLLKHIIILIDGIATRVYINSMFCYCLPEFDLYYYQNEQFVGKNNKKRETCHVFTVSEFLCYSSCVSP